MDSAFPEALRGSSRKRIGTVPKMLGPAVTGHLANPAVTAVMIAHDGRLWIERADGRAVPQDLFVTRRDAERMVRELVAWACPGSNRRRPVVVEDTASGVTVTAVPASRFLGPSLDVRPDVPPRLNRFRAAGLLEAVEADLIADLLRGGGNLLVAGPAAPARRLVMGAVLAEIARLGQRILSIQGTEWFPVSMPDMITLVPAPDMRLSLEASVEHLHPHRLVFPAAMMVAQPWLLKWISKRQGACIMTIPARRAEDGLERLARLIAGRDSAGKAANLIDASVFCAAPGAAWSVQRLHDVEAFGWEKPARRE